MKLNILLGLCIIILQGCTQLSDEIKLIPVKSGDKWGYVDKSGKFIINSQFEEAYNFSDGLALFKNSEDKWGFIGEDGKFVINPIYKDATKFSEGLAVVVMENGQPQVIDKQGKILFTVDKAEFCSGFKEGMAKIKIKGKYGFIDNTGKIVITPVYEDARNFHEGLAAVAKIDEKTKEEKWGFIDKTGAIKINFQFTEDKEKIFCEPDEFNEELVFVTTDGKQWGCIGKDGKYVINPQFEGTDFNPYGFKNGVSLVSQAGSFGFINTKGNYIINPQFKKALNFSVNGLAAVKHSDDKWGFINKEGQYVINPQFEDVIKGFIGDIAFVKSADKYGIINEKGLYVVNPQFDDVQLYDVDAIFGVKSDYVDNEGIASEFFKDSGPSKFLSYTTETNLGNIIDVYPEKTIDDLKPYLLEVSDPNFEISELIDVTEINFGFDDETYTETPIYKTVQKYSWYSGYYYDKEFDRFEKKIQLSAPLAYTTLGMRVKSTGKDKGKALAKAMKAKAIEKMKLTDFEDIEQIENEKKGLYLLKNENLMVYINYIEGTDENPEPSVAIYTIFNNYDRPFEDIAQGFIKGFNEESSD